MIAAEHLDRAEQYTAELESGDVASFAGSRQVAALVALTHAVIAVADMLGVPHQPPASPTGASS